MIKLPKEEADRLVLSILSELSKIEDKDFSEQSLQLMDNVFDNSILTGILLNKAIPSIFSDEEESLKNSLITIIGSFFYSIKEDNTDLSKFELSEKLLQFMSKENISKNGYKESIRMKFALTQFVNAFLEFERLEKKYPAVMKFM
jgi:hypothetical protein